MRHNLFREYLCNDSDNKDKRIYDNVIARKMDELYYLWQLAGGDITMELKKQGLIRSRPPILSVPKYIASLLYIVDTKNHRRFYSHFIFFSV